MPLTFADVYAIPQVAVASDGTVGLAWTDTSCNVHFAFDDLANSGPAGPGSGGSARISECSPQDFANIFTKFDIGAGAGELAVVITYGTGFNTTTTDVMNVGRGSVATMTLLARDTTVTAGSPRIGMTSSGEFVAIWSTESRGVWGVHRAAAAPSPESPFLVEAPFFSLGTPAVEGVHPRGDGRLVLPLKRGRPGLPAANRLLEQFSHRWVRCCRVSGDSAGDLLSVTRFGKFLTFPVRRQNRGMFELCCRNVGSLLNLGRGEGGGPLKAVSAGGRQY